MKILSYYDKFVTGYLRQSAFGTASAKNTDRQRVLIVFLFPEEVRDAGGF